MMCGALVWDSPMSTLLYRQSKGKITAESDIGVGTKMTIRLPVYHDV